MTSTTSTPGPRKLTLHRYRNDGAFVEIEVEERDDSGTLSPGFSVVGSLWEKGKPRTTARWDNPDSCGQIVDTVLEVAPELEPVLRVHLADQDGTPMHAIANGWYFYSGKSREYEDRTYGPEYAARFGTDLERAARSLHIDPEELAEGMTREEFTAFAEGLQTRWAEQARNAREVIDSLMDQDVTR
jgi:hypothetical protein